eukprot:6474586-Amphidinium_carterae.1
MDDLSFLMDRQQSFIKLFAGKGWIVPEWLQADCCLVGKTFAQYKAWYFGTLPQHLQNLDGQLQVATAGAPGDFFGGDAPTYADYNVYHHLNMARWFSVEERKLILSQVGEMF